MIDRDALDKIRKILRLLNSDKPGEVQAAEGAGPRRYREIEKPNSLIGLLDKARASENSQITIDEIRSAYDIQKDKGPYRQRAFFPLAISVISGGPEFPSPGRNL